jgi:perosamine synthetase
MNRSEITTPLFRVRVAPDATSALAAVLNSGQLAAGAQVAQFESALGEYLGNPLCVAMHDRSGALTVALRLTGVGPGDEVLLSPLVCLGTSMPIANLFARPVWCDVDPLTGMLDPEDIARRITARTKAIVLYHWAGDVGPLAALRAVADTHRLTLIDDAAAALGATNGTIRIGNTISDFTAFSFYAVNPLAAGEGGALACRTQAHFEVARWQKRYGIHQPSFRLANGDLNPASDIPIAGYNFAMTNLNAALALTQFDELDNVLNQHRDNGRYFDRALTGIPGITLLRRAANTESAYWVYALRAERRDDLLAKLHQHGIGAQRLHLRNDHYSCFSPASEPLSGVARFDVENLCLPCGWWVSEEARARIVDVIRAGW